MSISQPPLEYLVTCSQNSLEAFLLARLNRISNLQRDLGDLLCESIQIEGDERVAHLILERRRSAARTAGSPAPGFRSRKLCWLRLRGRGATASNLVPPSNRRLCEISSSDQPALLYIAKPAGPLAWIPSRERLWQSQRRATCASFLVHKSAPGNAARLELPRSERPNPIRAAFLRARVLPWPGGPIRVLSVV